MKLFVIAALVAIAAAGRLEHLERSYLPPDNSIDVARSSSGSNRGFGSPSSHGSFGANSGAFGAAGAGLQGHNAGGNFGGATSNQYLPPNHGPSANNGGSQFGSSLHGFGGQQGFRSQQGFGSQQQSGHQGHQASVGKQYLAPRSQFGSPQAGNSFGSPHAGSSFGSPHAGSSFGSPQAGSSFGAPSYQQFGQQSAAASRQYLAPRAGSHQQPPQQAFDEQTGYHY